MNPIGIHYGYWTQFWGSEPIQFAKRAQKCGFDILEINAPKVTRMSDSDRDTLKSAAADAGLGLTYSIGMTADMDLVSEDDATRKKGVTFLQDVARVWAGRSKKQEHGSAIFISANKIGGLRDGAGCLCPKFLAP